MKATMTVDDFFALTAEARDRFSRWLEEAVEQPITEAWIRSVTLGEGFISCEQIVRENQRPVIRNDEFLTETRTYPVRTLPPVWPA